MATACRGAAAVRSDLVSIVANASVLRTPGGRHEHWIKVRNLDYSRQEALVALQKLDRGTYRMNLRSFLMIVMSM